MKRSERHKIKTNEFAESVARARAMATERQGELTTVAVVIAVVLVAAGSFYAWRSSRNAKATGLLASALAVAEAPVVPPPPPAPGSPPPIQQPGTFRTDRDRMDAALPRLLQTADTYPTTDAGITARYRAAATLAALGRFPEAERQYQMVIDKAGHSSIYARTARLGLGDVLLAEGKTDAAIATFRDLSTDGDSPLPLDGVLMQLGRASLQAGKKDDASRAFTRVVDEFPQSPYAAEAKQKLSEIKKA